MLPLWSVVAAVAVLAVQLCIGEKSCVIRSSAESVVQRGSSFEVFCTFNLKCAGSMYSGQGPTKQSYGKLNSTTIYFRVVNITENRTYSCHCEDRKELDPCGLDISVGYLPERPKNISCIYKIRENESGFLVCTWNRGRDTNLRNSSVLLVKTVSGSHTVPCRLPNKGTELLSVNLTVPRSVQLISVWVHTENPLGSAQSAVINYTLRDIAMPSTPALSELKCSSRKCIIKVESVKIRHLEIQYRAEQQTWTTYQDSVVQRNSSLWSISSLEPYRLYHFRARSKFSTGLWSQWSENIFTWTEEEAPAREVDVWFARSALDFKSIRIHWKEGNISISRGKIIGYEVSILSPNYSIITNVSADARNYSVRLCANCEVTVRARNSKGLSPPAKVPTHLTEAKPLHNVQVRAGDGNITISWTKPKTAPSPTAYLLEWYPEGSSLEELRWVRLGKNENHTVISGIEPFECYEGALYAFYNENSFSKTKFKDDAALKSPEGAPVVQEKIDEKNNVKISWTALPRSQRKGCITKYTIYLETKGRPTFYSVPASERTYVIRDLPPAEYSLWMSASTGGGEGPASQKIKFFIEHDTQVFLLLVCVVASLIVLFLLCLCQNSTVKQRFWELFHCFMLDVVPDPANSKWAKEYTQEKGKMNLQLPPCNPSESREEEKLILVEELPKQNSDDSASRTIFSRATPPTSLSCETAPVIPATYIKSFSHDSDSSDHTHTSLDTTVDYISSHEPGNFDEEDEEEKEFIDMPFIPSHNIFTEPLVFGGKLTLDAVKIDCSDFFQNA